MEPMELALVAVVLLPEPEVTALGPEVAAAVAELRQVLALVAPGVAAQVAAGDGAALAGIQQQAGDGSVRGAVQAVAEAMRQRLGRGGQEKIAEKIGFLIQGGLNTFNIEQMQVLFRFVVEAPAPLARPYNLPISTVAKFVGRADDLVAVDGLVRANQRVNIAAAVGMGGVGKTELALQYALRAGDGFPGGVCWLNGRVTVASQMLGFAQTHLGLTVPENVENPVAWCWQHWPGEGPVLVVVDDVQDYGDLKPLLPGIARFRVLLTTRQAILPMGQRLPLEVLVPEAALELLRALVGPDRVAAEMEAAQALCEWVGRLPLGLELVGYYLALRPGLIIGELLQRLEGKKLAARALVETYPEMTATLGVAAAFELSWEPLSLEGKWVAAALGLFASAPVVWDWVAQTLKGLGDEGWDQETLEDAQVELLRVHFLQAIGTGAAARYQVHPLVREFFAAKRQEIPGGEALPSGFATVMVGIAETIPYAVTVAIREQVQGAVSHLEVVAAQWSEVLGDEDKTWCSIGLARFYKSLSLWEEAERCCQRAVIISRNQLGDRHPDTASSLNNLAYLYNSMGRYVEAEPLLSQALDIMKAELGERHPDTATSLNNLAGLYRAMGRYGEAEPLYTQALEIRKGSLGERHPDTVTSLNNLALLYNSMGRYGEAEPLYTQALEIMKAELGERHPDTASSLNNLAMLHHAMGCYGEAEPLYTQVLEIRKAELGERHPDTASSLNNLAMLYHAMGRYGEAEPLLSQALEIRKGSLGERHPDTAQGLNNLACLYHAMGRYGEAEPLYSQALEIRKAELGDCHPDTTTNLNNLAMLYHAMGRYGEAEPLYSQALEVRRAELGEHHPATATSLNNLAELYRAMNRYGEVEPLYAQALEIHRAELGERHPDTATSLNNLAELYRATSRYGEAEPLFTQAWKSGKQNWEIAILTPPPA